MLRVPDPTNHCRCKNQRCRCKSSLWNKQCSRTSRKIQKKSSFHCSRIETTAPTTASTMLNEPPENFSILSCHRLIPPALDFLISSGETNLNALIEPGHVCTIIGTKPFDHFSTKYGIPQATAGFNPLDILMAVYLILRQIKNDDPHVDNEYKRAVREEGNIVAQKAMDEVFTVKVENGRIPKCQTVFLN